jgi:hypothetical protein
MVLALVSVLIAGCSSSSPTGSASDGATDSDDVTSEQRFPDVLAAELTSEPAGTYAVTVTLSSPYDSPDRYAAGWRVLAPDGSELGSHTLTHDHASEQPFTRTQTGLEIPQQVTEVTVEGRDLRYGYGGGTATVAVPSRAE